MGRWAEWMSDAAAELALIPIRNHHCSTVAVEAAEVGSCGVVAALADLEDLHLG